MTAETDLLPLPKPLIYGQDYYFPDQMEAYARANLAELQREVEGLRAEVERLEIAGRLHSGTADLAINAVRAAEARAERLAGALRRMVGASYVVCTTIDPRGHRWCEAYLDEALPEARAALDQETTNG